MNRILLILIAGLLVSTPTLFGQDGAKPAGDKQGSIEGRVIDARTLAPVVGASVIVVGTQTGAATDSEGRYQIDRLDAGSYSLTFRSVGHSPLSRSDIVVRPGRITYANVSLQPAAVEIEGSKVRADFFEERPAQPTSTTEFSGEEVRRSPGSAGDVSRIIATLPSIAKVNDQLNSLLVRGGTPTENAFYVDNIMIPNINHYPLQGTSGGPIGLLNVDFVDNLEFSAGGFSAIYGDRLSAVMDIKFREGNRKEMDLQLDMSFAGLGLQGEGPLFSGKGSWMASIRRSYLDLLVNAIGSGVAPKYSDYQGKLVFDLGRNDQLSVLGIWGVDNIELDKESSVDDGNPFYGDYKGWEYVAGANWRHLWGTRGHSNTSFSYLGTRYDGVFRKTRADTTLAEDEIVAENLSTETMAQIRNVNTILFGERSHIDFGFEGTLYSYDYDAYVAEYTNPFGEFLPSLTIQDKITKPKYGAFASLSYSPIWRLTLTGGVRYDRFDYVDQDHISPRFSLQYRLTDRTTFNASAGQFFQNLPLGFIMQKEEYRELKDPESRHLIAGFTHNLTEDTRLTVEGYIKQYFNFPMDTATTETFIADEIISRGFLSNYDHIVDNGRARSYGVEATVQKKLVEGIYGLVSGSYFKSEFRDLTGEWSNRVIDNQATFAVEGGYKPNNKWQYSARWIFAGGAPYTPLDQELSALFGRSVYDESRVNAERNPAYHSLNLRVERRYNWRKSSMVVFLSIWNVYNRENVASRYWDEINNREETMYQWTMLPVGGFEWEF